MAKLTKPRSKLHVGNSARQEKLIPNLVPSKTTNDEQLPVKFTVNGSKSEATDLLEQLNLGRGGICSTHVQGYHEACNN